MPDPRPGHHRVRTLAAGGGAPDGKCHLTQSAPGIEHHYQQDDDGRHTAWMAHPDGSWARATSAGGDAPRVHQSGPRRLWDILDDIRHRWLREGSPPTYGAITPDSARGRWRAVSRWE
ncbi:MAG: hypothetical protein ACRDRW_20755 [Pseudonocardiaceae bacterium]